MNRCAFPLTPPRGLRLRRLPNAAVRAAGAAVGLFLALSARPVRAVLWDGGGTTSEWSEPANWQFNALPTTADTATIVNDLATITGVVVPTVTAVEVGQGTLSGGLTMAGGVNPAGLNALSTVTVAGAGNLALGAGGPALSTIGAANLATAGVTSILSRGVVNLSGQFTQTGGTVNLAGGAISAPTVLQRAGTFNAAGRIVGNLSIGDDAGTVATLALGASLDVQGNFKLASDARLAVEFRPALGGGVFDMIEVSGTATLGGVLDLSALSGASPVPGVDYAFLTAGSVQGAFTDIVGAAVGMGSWVPELNLSNGIIFSYNELRGNMNNDDSVDEDDVELFARAIRDADTYHTDYYLQGSVAEAFLADMDLDGSNTFADIPLFLDAVAQGGGSTQAALAGILAVLTAVPEPNTGTLAALLACAAGRHARRGGGARRRPA